jgi:hypothetical protein
MRLRIFVKVWRSRYINWAMGWTVRGSSSGRGKVYYFLQFILALGPIQPPTQWVQRALPRR